jgi:periplasmic protein TonB
VKGTDGVSDFFGMACPPAEADPLIHSSLLAPLELSAAGSMPFPARRIVARDLILGIGGAFLAHVFVMSVLLFLPFFQPPRNVREPFINVYLADVGEIAYNSYGGGLSEGAGGAEHSEDSSPEPESIEKTIAHEAPETAPALEWAATKPEARKTAASRAKTKITSKPKTPSTNTPEVATAVEEAVSQTTGTDLGRGQGQGEGNGSETGDGSGASGRGSSSSGTGLSGEYDAAVVDQPPQILKIIEPAYPVRARALGICGKVVVRFLVEPDGRVSRPSIVEARPAGYFEQSALEAVRRWQFKPGCFKGRVVSTWVTLPVQFRLVEQD